jgi:hypothetical protein
MSLRGTKQSKNLKKSLTTNNKTAKLKIVGKIKTTTNYINPNTIIIMTKTTYLEFSPGTDDFNTRIQAEVVSKLPNPAQIAIKDFRGKGGETLDAVFEAITNPNLSSKLHDSRIQTLNSINQ